MIWSTVHVNIAYWILHGQGYEVILRGMIVDSRTKQLRTHIQRLDGTTRRYASKVRQLRIKQVSEMFVLQG